MSYYAHAHTHTGDCVHEPFSAAEDCEPGIGVWNQPPRGWVDEALGGLPDGVPWCQVRMVALDLAAKAGE